MPHAAWQPRGGTTTVALSVFGKPGRQDKNIWGIRNPCGRLWVSFEKEGGGVVLRKI